MSDTKITVDLSAPAGLADTPALARTAFDWWTGELEALAPAWLRRLFPKPVETATLFVRGDAWRAVPAGDEKRALELDASVDDRGLADQILKAAPAFSLSRPTVILPRVDVLRRRVELPLMPDGDVRSAVELQIDRLSPFKSDAVRFAVRVVERDAVDGKLIADIAIVPRSVVETIEQRLTALGLAPIAIDFDGGNGQRAGFDFRAVRAEGTPRRAMLMNVAFAFGVAAMWYLALSAWDTAREREVESWQSRIVELRPLAQRSAVLRQQLEAMTQPFAMARTHKAGRSLDVLGELTKLLPDTVRLTEMRLAGDAIELTGLATEAPGLIAKLEASKLFKDVKFRSPVTRRPELNKERFEISLKLEGGAP